MKKLLLLPLLFVGSSVFASPDDQKKLHSDLIKVGCELNASYPNTQNQ